MLLRPFEAVRSFALVLAISAAAQAAHPSDTLLPATTKGYVSITSTQQLNANWEQTMYGQLARDESMKPFVDDLRRQLQRRGADIEAKVGLSLSDMAEVATGEMSLSIVLVNEREAAIVLTADVTGKRELAKQRLGEMDTNLARQQATRATLSASGIEMTVYTLPPDKKTNRREEITIFLHEDILCATNSPEISRGIATRFSTASKDSLRKLVPYQTTMARCAQNAGGMTPDIRWFVEPFGYVQASRLAKGSRNKRRGRDMAAILKRQGFDAIEGAGGYLHFYGNGQYELLHRTAVYAPGTQQPNGEKYRLAMRMLEFPAGGDLGPAAWVPRGIATYASFNWNLQKAFDNSSTLVNEFIGEGGFEDALRGIERNEFGPQVNIRDELVAHLGRRITIVTDYEIPITTSSERFLFAVETKNSPALADAVRKLMEHDRNAKERNFQGHAIWEIVEEVMEVPEIEIEDDLPFDPIEGPDEEEEKEEKPTFPNSCICVVEGRLLFASNIDFLKKILAQANEHETLSHSADFNVICGTLDQLASGQLCLRSFSRTDEEYRPTYELLRQGKMPESETLLGRVLNELLTEDDEEVRQQRFDGSKLPNFETVRRYFGPAGMAIRPESDGWFLVGVMLRKDTPLASQDEPGETRRR